MGNLLSVAPERMTCVMAAKTYGRQKALAKVSSPASSAAAAVAKSGVPLHGRGGFNFARRVFASVPLHCRAKSSSMVCKQTPLQSPRRCTIRSEPWQVPLAGPQMDKMQISLHGEAFAAPMPSSTAKTNRAHSVHSFDSQLHSTRLLSSAPCAIDTSIAYATQSLLGIEFPLAPQHQSVHSWRLTK